jgi:hypothetical protein
MLEMFEIELSKSNKLCRVRLVKQTCGLQNLLALLCSSVDANFCKFMANFHN